jgi:argininosuccinate lyase
LQTFSSKESNFAVIYFVEINSGACVRLAEEKEVSIDTLTLEQLQEIDSRFEADVMKVWDYEMSVERKNSIGGTSKATVQKQIDDCIAFAKTL